MPLALRGRRGSFLRLQLNFMNDNYLLCFQKEERKRLESLFSALWSLNIYSNLSDSICKGEKK